MYVEILEAAILRRIQGKNVVFNFEPCPTTFCVSNDCDAEVVF